MALASPAAAETVSATQFEDVAIPLVGNANPYPSELTLEGADGNMTDVNVSLNLSHAFPDDLDIAIVSPDGDSEILMSDSCGTNDLTATSITFDSEAGSPLSDSNACTSPAQPTNFGAGDNWPAPGPGAITTTQLANFNGEDPNGQWKLFVVDDENPDAGTVNNWTVTVTTTKAEIVIPSTGTSGKADPYPATETVGTPAGKVISDLNLEINEFNHMHPDDIDMLLAGPRRGATALVMSDACGSTDIHDYFWIFDDEAGAPMTDSEISGCNPFSIKPSNFGGNETLPAPAPAQPYGSTMSVFDGLEGGAFNLFVNDDAGSDTGFITGWAVKITTRDAADTGFAAASVRVEEGGKAVLEVKRTPPSGTPSSALGPATINVALEGSAKAGADYTAPAATLELARGETSKKIEIPIANDKVGEATERFKVTLSSPRDDARLVGTTSTEVTIGPDNEFKFGKLKRNAKKGTAKLFVTLPGPGKLVLTGEQVKKVKKTVKKAGKVGLLVKPKGNAADLLDEEGIAKLRAKVAFTPTDGSVFKKTKKLKLIEN